MANPFPANFEGLDGSRRLTGQVNFTDAANQPLSGQNVQTATVTLTDAQIKALPVTPVELITAPGVAQVVVVLGGLITVDATAGVYTNVTPAGTVGTSSLSLVYGNDDGQAAGYLQAESLLTAGLTHGLIVAPVHLIQVASPTTSDVTCVGENVRIIAYNAGGAYTGGDAANTMKVTAYYAIANA